MSILGIQQWYTELTTSVIISYQEMSRPILDVMHIIFDNAFYIILYIAAIVSSFYLIMAIYSLFVKNITREKKLKRDSAPFVTIQIPTYNELAALNCAKRCLNFDYPKDKYEIIIGDDSNKPEISSEFDAFAAAHSDMVRVTRRGGNKGFKPGNLNHMLKQSNGEILVIFDSDFLPNKDFLRRIAAPFQYDDNVAAVQARWSYIDQDKNLVSILSSTITTTFHFVALPFAYKNAEVCVICGSAEAVKKKDLIELGGWREGSLTEDIEYSLRMIKAGKKVVYLDKLECKGEVPNTTKDIYKQQMRWAYGVTNSLMLHFNDIRKSKKIDFSKKFFAVLFCGGYVFSLLLALLFLTGTLSFVTNAPGPIDFPRFFSETAFNILLTSGIVLTSVFALINAKKAKHAFKLIVASFSIGLIVTLYVNIGLFKLATKQPMQWFMLSKKGNILKK